MSLLQTLEKKTYSPRFIPGGIYYADGGYTMAHDGKQWRILLNHKVVLTEEHENFQAIREEMNFKPFKVIDTDNFDNGETWKENELFNKWHLESIGLQEVAENVPDYDILGYFSEFSDHEYIGEFDHYTPKSKVS